MQDREFEMALNAISENVEPEEFDVIIAEASEMLELGNVEDLDEAVAIAAVALSDAGVISENAYAVTDAVMESYGDTMALAYLRESVDQDTFDAIITEASEYTAMGYSITEAVDAVLDEASPPTTFGQDAAAAYQTAKHVAKSAWDKSKGAVGVAGRVTGVSDLANAAKHSRKAATYNERLKNAQNAHKGAQAKYANIKKKAYADAMAAHGGKSYKGMRKDVQKDQRVVAARNTLNAANAAEKQARNNSGSQHAAMASHSARVGAAKLAGTAAVALGAKRAYDNYKNHGDALYDIHRLQEKRRQRKALAAGQNESVDSIGEAATAIAYLNGEL